MKSILLIGFMGSGKSTVAKLLSAALGLPHLELDEIIITRSGRASIRDLVEQDGEARFREIEYEVLAESLLMGPSVISPGGGAVCAKRNQALLNPSTIDIIFLETSFSTVCRRLVDPTSRPVFKNLEHAQSLFNERAEIYRSLASTIVSTEGKSPEEICSEITSIVASA